MITRALCWMKVGRLERALAIVDAALLGEFHSNLYLRRAELLEFLGRRDDALKSYVTAVVWDLGGGEARVALLEALAAWGWDAQRMTELMAKVDELE